MKRHIVTLALAGLCVVLAAQLATAQVPPLMNYQGVLLTSGGQPVTAPVTVVFTIYDTLADGSTLWTETRNVTPDAAGLFTINLGEVNPLTNTVFTGPDRWLGIRVGAEPEVTPRTRLVTVPYAQRAATVDGGGTAGWTDDGTVVRLTDGTDRVGIGTTAPNEQLEITGNLRLPPSTAIAGVIKSGDERFIHNFGTDNTFIGINAGNLTMTGYSNTASGAYALNSNTTGFANIASGHYALVLNTTGRNNTASGTSALLRNNTGDNNTASGAAALWSNTTGCANSASGYEALFSNTTGFGNTASGTSALRSCTTGSYNTACGVNALYSNTTVDSLTASGTGALQRNTTGQYNTANGAGALTNNTSGICNTAIGMRALYSNIDGNGNTASGMSALQLNTTGYRNTAAGREALYSNTDGDSNTACGANALYNNTTGSLNTAIGYRANVSTGNLTNATAIGNGAVVTVSNGMMFGNPGVVSWGFGATPSAGRALQVGTGATNGNGAYLTTGGTWTNTSDRNLKEGIALVDGSELLQKVNRLPVYRWNYKGEDPSHQHVGPMAQDFHAVFGLGDDDKHISTIDPAGVALAAIQALYQKINEQAAENEELRSQIAELREMIRAQASKQK